MSRIRFAYNTNGCANHRLGDAIDLIAAAGYDGIALTLDWHHLDPFADDWRDETRAIGRRLTDAGLGVVIETGARYLLDPRAKHEPTLVTPTADGRARRAVFLRRAAEIGALLGAEAVSFWAGVVRDGAGAAAVTDRIVETLPAILEHAADEGVTMAMEPEPGMAIETVEDMLRLRQALAERTAAPLTLALDVGHLWVTGEIDPPDGIRTYRDIIGTAAIEGMARGTHVHLPFGEGDLDVPACLEAFGEIGFERLICVELSRESPRAHEAIPQSITWLKEHLS